MNTKYKEEDLELRAREGEKIGIIFTISWLTEDEALWALSKWIQNFYWETPRKEVPEEDCNTISEKYRRELSIYNFRGVTTCV
jgi:hypothetical protein